MLGMFPEAKAPILKLVDHVRACCRRETWQQMVEPVIEPWAMGE